MLNITREQWYMMKRCYTETAHGMKPIMFLIMFTAVFPFMLKPPLHARGLRVLPLILQVIFYGLPVLMITWELPK